MRAAPFPEIHGFGSLPSAIGRPRTQAETGMFTPSVHRRQTPLRQASEAKFSTLSPASHHIRVHQPSYRNVAKRLGLARLVLGARPYFEHIRILRGQPEASTLLLYLGISFSFTTILLVYALWSRSVELMSASFHNYFHCLVLCVSLGAIAVSLQQHDYQHYTYGLERGHILAAFTNGIFLVFMSMFFVMEALHHLTSKQHHHHHESLWV